MHVCMFQMIMIVFSWFKRIFLYYVQEMYQLKFFISNFHNAKKQGYVVTEVAQGLNACRYKFASSFIYFNDSQDFTKHLRWNFLR